MYLKFQPDILLLYNNIGLGYSLQCEAAYFFTLFRDTQCISLPEGGLGADLCQVCKSFLADIDPLCLSTDFDDLQTTPSLVTNTQTSHITHADILTQTHLLQLLRCVQHSADYHNSVQQVQRNSVRRANVLCPPGEQQMINSANLTLLLSFEDCVLSINLILTNLIKQFPLLEANTTMGAMVLSSARWRYVKHSMSSMCTSSTNNTPGTSSATPWSM